MLAASSGPTAPRRITLHQYSDFWCLWCFIGHHELNAAIERCKRERLPVEFDVEYKPFLLAPDLKDSQLIPRTEFFAQKMGEEKTHMMYKLAGDRFKTFGVNQMKSGPVCSTMRAHRLMQLAYKRGGSQLQQELCHRLFSDLNECEKNLNCTNGLAQAAEDIGILPRDQALAWLKGNELEDEVRAMVEAAKSNGVTGVPFTVIDGKWAVGGGQPPDVYYQIFAKLASIPQS